MNPSEWPEPIRRRVAEQAPYALFWSFFAFFSTFYFVLPTIVSVHQAINAASANVVWDFWLTRGHPDAPALVGFAQVFIGYAAYLNMKLFGVERFFLMPGRFEGWWIIAVIFSAYALLPIANGLTNIISPFFGIEDLPISEEGAGYNTVDYSFVAIVLAAVVIAPVVEEVLFRGYLMTSLMANRVPTFLVVIVSSAAFAFLHQQYTLKGMVFIFLISCFFAGLRLISRGVLLPIIAHFAYNAALVFR